ncbi:hypothetical protein Dsin_008874 [Dipteronia sinensis]|uniref:DUF4283 domain-containing protein n=1 Tax=Dipteronia sinensis TaxID=43782 RepID=A0AAE0AQP2_9ROSI|nr:hypothetical protein Dsin_008874 [Dipteronia sinensis]
MEFWAQVRNLPLMCMSEEIGLFLGNMIGEVRDIDLEAGKNGSGRFIRVWVVIKVDEPLRRSLRVDLLGDGKVTTMLLRYERVPDFCYKCSKPCHTLGECSLAASNQKGRRGWREVGSGLFGLGDASRTQVDWRARKKSPELADGRTKIIQPIRGKDNLGLLISRVACVETNKRNHDYLDGDMNHDYTASEVTGINHFDGCMTSFSKDHDMPCHEALGFDPGRYPATGCDPSPSISPINKGDCWDGRGIGLSDLVSRVVVRPLISTHNPSTWRQVDQDGKCKQDQHNLGVILGKRDLQISSARRTSLVKRAKVEVPGLVFESKGLGNDQAFRVLRELKQDNCPDVMVLFKTKTNQISCRCASDLSCSSAVETHRNVDWKGLFQWSVVQHLDYWRSDHRPILINVKEGCGVATAPSGNKGRPFIFDDCWADE